MSLLVLCPTRNRQSAVREAYQSFVATKELPDTRIAFVVNDYESMAYPDIPTLVVPRQDWMNEVLQAGFEKTESDIVGFIGDDNRFRTPGWDRWVVNVLTSNGGGYAYTNDLMQGPNLPCHVFVTAEIARRLGYFGLRGLHHMYIDNAWRVLGDGADCLYYIEHVVIEHLHPLVGKSNWDDSYRASNAQEVYDHDRRRFSAWLENEAEADIQIVRQSIGH